MLALLLCAASVAQVPASGVPVFEIVAILLALIGIAAAIAHQVRARRRDLQVESAPTLFRMPEPRPVQRRPLDAVHRHEKIAEADDALRQLTRAWRREAA